MSKCSKELKKDFKNLLQRNQCLVAKLTKWIERVEKHHVDCLIAKTTGVTVAAVGTSMVVGGWIAGLVLAVPTFGLSLTVPAVMTVAGTATAVAGGLTTAGTEIANGVITNQFMNELKNIQEAQALAVKVTEKKLQKINFIINELKEDENQDEALVIKLILQGIESGEVDLDNIDETIHQLQLKLRMCKPGKISGYSTGKSVSGGIRVAGAALNITNAVVASGSQLVDDVTIHILRSVGIGTGSAVIQGALRGMAASAGVIFTVIDIVRLVNDYTETNPLIIELKRIKGLYLSDINDCQKFLSIWK